MIKTIIEHKVKNFDTFKQVYNSASDLVKRAGGTNDTLGTVHGNRNHVVITGEWQNVESFNKFFNSPELKQKIQESGATTAPTVTLLNEVSRG